MTKTKDFVNDMENADLKDSDFSGINKAMMVNEYIRLKVSCNEFDGMTKVERDKEIHFQIKHENLAYEISRLLLKYKSMDVYKPTLKEVQNAIKVLSKGD